MSTFVESLTLTPISPVAPGWAVSPVLDAILTVSLFNDLSGGFLFVFGDNEAPLLVLLLGLDFDRC
jgi:hypothetical protein